MNVKIELSQNTLVFGFQAGHADLESGRNSGQGTDFSPAQEGRLKLARDQCQFTMPEGWTLDSVHPDALALASVMLVYAFAGKRIALSFAVSTEFASCLKQATGIEVSPVDSSIKPRVSLETASPGLAFSGGVDSTAALLVMPKDTKLFFVDRVFPKGEAPPTKYNKEHALYACKYLAEVGRDVYEVPSDFEYIRNPVGVGVDLGFGIPALLLCDYANLHGLAYGMIAESAYRTGHAAFEDYVGRSHYKRWWHLFEIVDMPLTLPTAGMSEVATSKIVMESCHRGLAQSCVRGGIHDPCMCCWKCVRKTLLDNAIAGIDPTSEALRVMFSTRDAKRYLAAESIKHENVVTWITSRYEGDDELMLALKQKVRGDTLEVGWMEKWFPDSRVLLPPRYRAQIEEQIRQKLGVMDEAECLEMRGWNLGATLQTEKAKADHGRVQELFETIGEPRQMAKRDYRVSGSEALAAASEVKILTRENHRLQGQMDSMRGSTRWRVATFFKKAFTGQYPFRPRNQDTHER